MNYRVPLVIRGQVIDDCPVRFGGRHARVEFDAADAAAHVARLPLERPSALEDLYRLSFGDILDYLEELGKRLTLSKNEYLQEALQLSIQTSGLGEAILRRCYETLGSVFDRERVRREADVNLGIPFLEGWVQIAADDGYSIAVRAFGARSVHVVAGNIPTVSALTVVRNAMTRGDMIVKTPSNDPLTAAAIARTMIDLDSTHPITRHITVAYWKGGDARVEERLYQPRCIEKIIAWGGLASIRHIAKYIQPGIDLITLDPKLSSTIIGSAAFADEHAMTEAAKRLAVDVGALNQEACVNARVIYIQTGTDADGLRSANRFGQLLYDAIQALPPHLSNPARQIDVSLREELEGLKFARDVYRIIGGDCRGGVIVSQSDEPVDFSRCLANRVANLVPFDSLDVPLTAVNAYTQTIGIYPESLAHELRDGVAFHGGQRLVSLGYATRMAPAGPADGLEPLRRMVKWIAHETYDPGIIPPVPSPDQAVG